CVGVLVAILTTRGGASAAIVPTQDSISRLDEVSRAFATTAPVGNGPSGVAVGSGYVWVTNVTDPTLSRVDPSEARTLAAVGVGGPPTGMATGAGSIWVSAGFGLGGGGGGGLLPRGPALGGAPHRVPPGGGVGARA